MLKLIGWLLKATFFTIVILIASQLITWNGKTVSDQVRSTLSSAEHILPTKTAIKTVKKTSQSLVEDAKEAASKIGVAGSEDDKIPNSDKKELQALIRN